jgi:hypothetical protein
LAVAHWRATGGRRALCESEACASTMGLQGHLCCVAHLLGQGEMLMRVCLPTDANLKRATIICRGQCPEFVNPIEAAIEQELNNISLI